MVNACCSLPFVGKTLNILLLYVHARGKNILQCSSFRESMKLGCKGNCCVFHLYKVFRWYGLTIFTPFGLYSEP